MIRALFVVAALAAPAAATLKTSGGDYGNESGCPLSPAAIVMPFVKGVLIDNDPSVIDTYVSDDFVDHNPNGPGGIAGKEALVGFAVPEIEFKAGLTVVEDDKVFIQGRYTGTGPTPQIAVDVYRVEGDKIVEHWDALTDEVPTSETVSGNAMFEEVPGALDDFDPCYTPQDTSDDIASVLAFFKGAFDELDPAAVETYISDGYIQHNPTVSNGREPLFSFLQSADGGFIEVGQVASQNGIVFAHSRFSGGAVGPVPLIAFDIYRVENGVIMEHWDVLQPEVTDTASGVPMFTPDPSLLDSVA